MQEKKSLLVAYALRYYLLSSHDVIFPQEPNAPGCTGQSRRKLSRLPLLLGAGHAAARLRLQDQPRCQQP